MKKMLAVLVAGAVVSPALASTLNLTVKSGGSSSVNVAPGSTVNFTVEGVLNDNLNEGLALIGFDLHFTGGALAANTVVTPVANPMKAFVKPDGITNPAGFIGTPIGGDLVQVGGGQNTIKNSVDNPACAPNCAPFPVGTPILGIAQVGQPVVIASGSFTAPNSGGPFTLQVLNGFANVIKDNETLANAFLATEAANVNVVANLTVTLGGCGGIVSSNPAKCNVDARRPFPPNTPGSPSTVNSIALTMANGCGAAAPSDFAVACTPAGAPCPTVSNVQNAANTATVTFSTAIPAGKWTCVTHTASGTSACIGSLPGDANGDRTAGPSDIIKEIDHLNGVAVPPLALDHCDMDRSGVCGPPDIVTLIDLLNGASAYGVWNGKTLAACPSP